MSLYEIFFTDQNDKESVKEYIAGLSAKKNKDSRI